MENLNSSSTFSTRLLLAPALMFFIQATHAQGLSGHVLRDTMVQSIVAVRAATEEIENPEKPSQRALPRQPLPASNGDLTRAPSKQAPTISPASLAETLERQTPEERQALLNDIDRELTQLQTELAVRNEIAEKTANINLEIYGINEAITAKQQAREYVAGQLSSFSSAAAESFAALTNPFFLICKDSLWAPKDPVKWIDRFSLQRKNLVDSGRSVGLVLLNNRPAGTGFVVGPKHIITNFHVLKSIAVLDEAKGVWTIRPGAKIIFDVEYALGKGAECESPNKPRAYFLNAVFALPRESDDDLAIIMTSSDQMYPRPLDVVEKPIDRYAGNMIVAVIGYPGPPADMTVAEQIEFFQTPDKITPQFHYKRISGGFTGIEKVGEDGFFVHKANTAGGNSGSPLFDLEDGSVVGIHVEGKNRFQDTLGYNRALVSARVNRLLLDSGLKRN
ncbi:serine protease [Methyloversatilis sp. XJ19-13]|uniref:trypsin-like serine peptidase n=1 Tax=Methyloversatilis sp. XJ19-13 TaxID=2963430 RepID=UPI00211C5A57|nr:serine protease [Methyloversatilis sp. XJ19-13]MCQ9376299.1 serine protease [Methyloversatilis sp. XJ19-13]